MEPTSFWMPTEIFTIGVLCLFAAVPVVLLIVTRDRSWGDTRAAAVSRRARLPFGTDAVHRSVRARLRSLAQATMWGMFVGITVAGTVFLTTSLATTNPNAMLILTVLLVVAVISAGNLAAQLRERLFSPVPDAPRVARPVALGTRDYLGPWRTFAPVALLTSAIATTATLVVTTGLDLTPLGPTLAACAALTLAIATTLGTRWAERLVLSRAQPASDTLELAWDDLFRADALSTLRMSAAMTAWLPFGMAAALLGAVWFTPQTPELVTLTGALPWLGILVIQQLYSLGTGRLPTALYPEFLRRPAAAAVVA